MANADLIKQYVNTGAIIPHSQLLKLNDNLLRSYFRRRFAQAAENDMFHIREREYEVMPEDVFESYVATGPLIPEVIFEVKLTPEQKRKYLDGKLNVIQQGIDSEWKNMQPRKMLNHEMLSMTPEQVRRYEGMGEIIPNAIKEKRQIIFGPREMKVKHMNNLLKSGSFMPDWVWNLVEDEEMFMMILPSIGEFIHPKDIPVKFMKLYVKKRIEDGHTIFDSDLNRMTEEDQQECLMLQIEKNIERITDQNLDRMSEETFDYYIEKINE